MIQSLTLHCFCPSLDVFCEQTLWVLIIEAKIIHESGKMERADPHQATSGQRDDYILWIDSREFKKGMGQTGAVASKLRLVVVGMFIYQRFGSMVIPVDLN